MYALILTLGVTFNNRFNTEYKKENMKNCSLPIFISLEKYEIIFRCSNIFVGDFWIHFWPREAQDLRGEG